MTASPGKTYSNDILGNRTGMTGNVVYTWDALNRMTSFTSGSNPTVSYTTSANYCASIGHKHDDESSLIYMRARYYEPGSGRFTSEDPDREGSNFASYANSDPLNKVDGDGRGSFGINFLAKAVDRFLLLMKSFGVPTKILDIPIIITIITKLMLDLRTFACAAQESYLTMNLGLALSVCNPLGGAGMAIAGGLGASLCVVLAFFEIYNAAMAIMILTEDLLE